MYEGYWATELEGAKTGYGSEVELEEREGGGANPLVPSKSNYVGQISSRRNQETIDYLMVEPTLVLSS